MQAVKDYSHLQENERAVRTVLKTGRSLSLDRTYLLIHSTAGYEPAGSRARYTAEKWLITFNMSGVVHGREFATLAAAESMLASWCAQ